MLLLPTVPCNMYPSYQSTRPQRPKLPSFERYEPSTPSPKSGPGGILASCRALQSVTGSAVHTYPSPPVESPTVKSSYRFNPFRSRRRPQSPQRPAPPSHGMNKRGRDEFEESDTMDLDDMQTTLREPSIYKTPKRQRRIMVDLPLGLDASDFSGLEPTRGLFSRPIVDPMEEDGPLVDDGNNGSFAFQFQPPRLIQTDSESTEWSSFSDGRDDYTETVVEDVDTGQDLNDITLLPGHLRGLPGYREDFLGGGCKTVLQRMIG